MPITTVSVLLKIYKQLFKRIFRAFSIIFCASPWVRVGYCAPSTLENLRPSLFLLIRPPPILKFDAIKQKSDRLPVLRHFKMAAIEIWKSRFVP